MNKSYYNFIEFTLIINKFKKACQAYLDHQYQEDHQAARWKQAVRWKQVARWKQAVHWKRADHWKQAVYCLEELMMKVYVTIQE